MTKAVWLLIIGVILVFWGAMKIASRAQGSYEAPQGTPRPAFQPVMPKIKEVGVNPADPHYCMKPDDAQFRGFGPAQVVAPVARQFHDPGFLFDTKHSDNKVTWANEFSGKVIVCFVVDEKGMPVDFSFPASPGKDIEDHIKDGFSGWRWTPGWYQEGWSDQEHHILKTQMAYNVIIPE